MSSFTSVTTPDVDVSSACSANSLSLMSNVRAGEIVCKDENSIPDMGLSPCASFRVQIRVNSSDMKCVLELFMANESGPKGVFVRCYFPPKQQIG